MIWPFMLLFGAAAMSGNKQRAQSPNGPGVRYVPAATPVRTTVPAAKLAAPPPARAAPATPKPKPALNITPAPGTPLPATAAERAAVEKAVAQAVAQHQAATEPRTAAEAPLTPIDPWTQPRSPKEAATQLAQFLKRTGRFGSAADRVPEIQAAQRDLHVADDGIVGPVTRAAAAKAGVKLPPKPVKLQPTAAPSAPATATSSRRSPAEAARDLAEFLSATHRFGSKTDRPTEVKLAQRDLGVAADGIVGSKTRAAAQRAGVTLPKP